MPTPGGLPKPGEIWIRKYRLPPDWKWHVIVFKVLERGRGDYWSMRVKMLKVDGELPDQFHRGPQLWVDPAYWMSRGELEFVQKGA